MAIAAACAMAIFLSACALFGPRVETREYVTADGAILVESLTLTATVM
jgi:hypothetical protein